MIRRLRDALADMPDPKRVTVKSWRRDAAKDRLTLGAHQRINVAHPKARFADRDPHTPNTAWVNPTRIAVGVLWVGAVAGLAVYGRKTGRGLLGGLHDWEPFSAGDDSR